MNCCKVQTQLSAYVDRELTGHESLAMRDHIACCPECCTAYESVRRVKHIAATLTMVEPKEELLKTLQSAVNSEERNRRIHFRPSSLMIAVAAGAALAFATFTFQARADVNLAETENQTPAGDVYAGGIDAFGGYRPTNVARYGE